MFKIGEFSRLTQVSIRMLRYYDEKALLKPAHIDSFTNYRYYTVEQIPLLYKIVFLRNTGYSINEMHAALQNWNSDYMKEHLVNKKAEIQENIEKEKEKLRQLEHALTDINKGKTGIRYNFSVKSIPSYFVLSLRKVIPDYFHEGLLWEELGAFMAEHNLPDSEKDNPAALSFAIYHDLDYKDKNVDVEICIPIGEKYAFPIGEHKGISFHRTDPVEKAACTLVYGPYENIGDAYLSFAQWLAEHTSYNMTYSRQICHRGPWNENDPEKYLTEMQIYLESHTV